MSFKKTFFPFLIILLFFSCNSKKHEVTVITEMEFQVLDSLLNDNPLKLSDSCIMRVPAYWNEDSSLLEPLSEKLKKTNPYSLDLQKCFYHDASKSILLVSSINNLDENDYNSVIFVLKKEKKKSINFAQFRHNKIQFDQLISQDAASVSLKFMIYDKTKGKFQIDFIIPVEQYSKISKQIESSIGSVNLIL